MRTIEEITARMTAIMTAADARPEDERALTDPEVTEYEALEAELATVNRNVQLRSRHAAYMTPIAGRTPPAAAGAGNDEVLDRAFDSYLRTGQQNMDLVELRAQGVGVDSTGGYLVPDGFRTKLVERRKAFGGIASVVENITTETGAPLPWPTIDDTANSGEIVAEHATGAGGADATFGTGTALGAYRYMALGANNLPLRISVELLQDAAFDVAGKVAGWLGKRIARKQAVDWVQGDGSGEPKGINYRAATIELATGNAITYAKLVDVVHAVDPDYRDGARWAFNDATAGVIQKLVDDNGRPLWLPATSGDLSSGLPGGTLLGYPVTIDQAFPDIADSTGAAAEGFAVFGNLLEGYVIRHVRDVVVFVDPYTRAAYGEVQYHAWARADGTIQDSYAYVAVAGYNAP